MKMSRLGYFSEFLLFPPLLVVATLWAYRSPTPAHPVGLAALYGAGLSAWTLIEYVLHRAVFHHAPILSRIHEAHHHDPQDLIGTPGWASASIGIVVVAGPLCATLGFDFGAAATAGLATGYLWYVFVHYATHHWRPRRNTYLYRARLRHARHHHMSESGNFGVTTGFWDHVFGTALEMPEGRRAEAG
ncbi:MAG: sterol desaturase family protein [Proteobacteria bacterium]|nr:sterol desaturase family protein [Pseudomonadota bacterium]